MFKAVCKGATKVRQAHTPKSSETMHIQHTRLQQTVVVENLKGKHLVIQFKANEKASERCKHGGFLKVCLHSVFFVHASANLRLAMLGTAGHG